MRASQGPVCIKGQVAMPSFGSLLPADVFRAVAKKRCGGTHAPPPPGQGPSNQGCGGVEISDGSGSGSGEKKIGFGSGSGSGFDSSTQFILYTNKYGWKRKDEGLVHVVSVFA